LTNFFSIIIPTFNSESTLYRAVDSVLNQTYQHFEILIIDNFSSDNTISILEKFESKAIKIHQSNDNGIYDAMNKGIEISCGNWLYFLGSDDYIIDDLVLDRINEFINKIGDIQVIYGNVLSDRFNGVYGREFNVEMLFRKNICHQAIFFEKTVFTTVGNFLLNYRAQSDWHHNLKWLTSGRVKKKYVNYTIAYYSDGGFSSKFGDELFAKEKAFEFLKYTSIFGNFYFYRRLLLNELIKNYNLKSYKKLIKLIFVKVLND
jgi:glycosyltransferase involved in cell wall biosynthesis